MNNIKTLFFDVGYTLVNEDAVWKRRCKEQTEMIGDRIDNDIAPVKSLGFYE